MAITKNARRTGARAIQVDQALRARFTAIAELAFATAFNEMCSYAAKAHPKGSLPGLRRAYLEAMRAQISWHEEAFQSEDPLSRAA
jgi:hypothetical protein